MTGPQYSFSMIGTDLLTLRNMAVQVSYSHMNSIVDVFGTTTDADEELDALRTLAEQSTLQFPLHKFLLDAIKWAVKENRLDQPIKLVLCAAWQEWLTKVIWNEKLDPDNIDQVSRLKAQGRDVAEYRTKVERIRAVLGAAQLSAVSKDAEPALTMKAPAGAQ